MKKILKDILFILIFLVLLGAYTYFIYYKTIEVKVIEGLYENYLLILGPKVLTDSLVIKDTLKNTYGMKKFFGKGIWLISTVSPGDCAPCLNKQIKFLRILEKEIPYLNKALIVIAYPNKNEITPWLKELGIYGNYYFHFPNFIEHYYAPMGTTYMAWNFLFIDGKIKAAFSGPDSWMETKVYLKILHRVLKKELFN